jgi:hypothetical protein
MLEAGKTHRELAFRPHDSFRRAQLGPGRQQIDNRTVPGKPAMLLAPLRGPSTRDEHRRKFREAIEI